MNLLAILVKPHLYVGPLNVGNGIFIGLKPDTSNCIAVKLGSFITWVWKSGQEEQY